MSEDKILQPEQNYGPGNVLRAKREEYEWSVDAVAEALHLSTSAVKSIEADRYDELPGSTYVMGYWRSYARLLGIDIEDTIEANKRNLNVVTSDSSGMDVIRPPSHKKSSGFGGWLLILIALAAFGYFAWQQQFFGLLDQFQAAQKGESMQVQPQQVPPAEAEVQSEPEVQVLRPLEKPEAVVVENPASPESDRDTNLLSAQSPGSSGGLVMAVDKKVAAVEPEKAEEADKAKMVMTPAVDSTDTKTTGNSGNDTDTAVTITTLEDSKIPDTSSQAADSAESAEASTEASSNEASAAAAPVNAAGISTLVLNVDKKTWLDVRDSTKKRLLFAWKNPGDMEEIKGVAPFYITMQPPGGARVAHKGKNFPVPAGKNGLTVRFKLDEKLELY